MTTTVRSRAIAAQDAAIESNIATIQEQRARPTAIQAMAQRLNLTPGKLQETLRATVFRDANDNEFAALIVVANEYRLNPLTKEIFAFKAKGGGIIPYVSVDGWIRIINEHPQFDGVEFNDIVDQSGKLDSIECVIWRKDRARPIRVTEYLEECYRDTDPWKKSPKRFLRHRALMQCGRVAFGFSGISNEDDYEVVGYAPRDGGDLARQVPPSRTQIAHNPDTGEIIDDNTLAELDRNSFAEMDRDLGHASSSSSSTPDDRSEARQQPSEHEGDGYQEGPTDAQMGEAHGATASEDKIVETMLGHIARQQSQADVDAYMRKRKVQIDGFSETNQQRLHLAAMGRMG